MQNSPSTSLYDMSSYTFFGSIWELSVRFLNVFRGSNTRKDVSNEVVLVTGAGSGLGRLMSLRFAALGAVVVCVDINTEGNEETVKEIRSKDQRAVSFTCDLSKKEDIYRVADEVRSQVGNVTILVNNAGIVSGRKFLDTPDKLVEKTFEVNTLAHCLTVKAFLPNMLANNHGHVISIASSAGLAGIARLCDYCCSKFAAIGFSESLQMELSGQGYHKIHTTIVNPYMVDTGMFEGAKTRFPSLLPILKAEETVDRIMEGVLKNERIIVIPKLLSLLIILKSILPMESFITMSNFFGATQCMDDFTGRTEMKKS